MSNVVVRKDYWFVRSDFAENVIGKTFDTTSEEFHRIFAPFVINRDDYTLCLVEVSYNIGRLKVIKIVSFDDFLENFAPDTDVVHYFVRKYIDDSDSLNKIVEAARKHKAVWTVILSLLYLLKKRLEYIPDLIKLADKSERETVINIIMKYTKPDNELFEKYIRTILETYTDVNSTVLLFVYLDVILFQKNRRLQKELALTLLERIKKQQKRLNRRNLLTLIGNCKMFVFSRELCKIIFRQIKSRFKTDASLIYSFIINCKYKIEELFPLLCESDKTYRYVRRVIEKFPIVDKNVAKQILYQKTYNSELLENAQYILDSFFIGD